MDQVKSNFFENQILEAIETVATGVVSKLQFDQTILCTITNDNKRKNGEYEVSDGSSTFKAFSSDTNYKKDMAVYVLVPQGDFERQKTIVGKYVDDSASAINYIPASQSIIEVAKMEIPQNEFGLLANGETKLITIADSDWDNTNIYDCVSLKASFKTDLSKYNIIDGDYGLILTLEGYQVKSETKEDGTLAQTTVKASPKFYKFSCKDMFGDPYNYNTYFDQDIVFNLSEYFTDIKINHYRLDFYQNGKFKDLSGNDIPYKDKYYNINFNNNLFVKDIQMSFGYSTVNIKEEGIQIYTPDNLKYINRLPAKNIVLKWFQKNEVGNNTAYGVIDTLDEAKENNYSVYWYRYRIGASEDELAGAFWELLDAGAYNDNVNYGYQLIKDLDGKYTYKDSKLILAGSDTKQEDKYKMEIKIESGTGRYDDEKSTEDPFNISFAPDKLLNREKIKAILVKYEFEEIQEVDENDSDIVYITFELSPKIYESNEIIFENANPASLSLAAVDLIKNMRLECTDDSNGVYKLYNTVDNEIINNENTKEKILEVFFDTYSSRDIQKDDEQCKITWKIPRYNSMINPVNFTVNKNINKILDEGDSSEIQTLGESLVNVSWSESGNYHTCSYEWNSNIAGFDSVHEDAMLSMKYSIDKFYSQSYSNNTIICEIEKYGKTYTAEMEFIFGETGTNGTGYTVSLKLEKEYYAGGSAATTTAVPCVTYNGEMVKVIASLFDEHGKDISEGKVFAWDWLNGAVGFNCLEGGNNYCYIQHDKSTAVKDCYGILSATVAGTWLDKNVQLTGYLPLGIRSSSSSMKTYEGTTKIIYNEQGSRPTYQKEHSLDAATNDWKIQVLKDNTWRNFAPYFKERKVDDVGPWILVARDMYFSDLAKKQIVIHAYSGSNVIYSQSLLYDQNRFGNAMFNNWDGSLVVDNGDNKILAAIVGAGKKEESNNTFTGVVMGETSSNTGLFGYYQGTQTFGFNTDGTAFIGASGQGQIKFDGMHGTIKSATGNTELDLKNGKIYLSNGSSGTANITIDSSNSQGRGYFSIRHLDGTDAGKQLIYIGPSQYYLQSTDYENKKSGIKINLKTGLFELNPHKILKTPSDISASSSESSFISSLNAAFIQISSNQTPFFEIKAIKGIKKTESGDYDLDKGYLQFEYTPLIHIGDDYYLKSKDYADSTSGIKLDLQSGKLTGYNFLIQASNSTGDTITINSSHTTTPLIIGDNFSVKWDGTMSATNGSFTGTVTATSGSFSGEIKASSGNIGGWVIVPNALYYGSSDDHQFNETNNYLTSFSTGASRAFFAPGGATTKNFKYSTTTYEVTTDSKTGEYTGTKTDDDNNSLGSSVNILFNVGQNFAITTDGTVYANALYLKDYAKTTDLKTLSDKAFEGINKNISSIGSINSEIGDMNKQYGSIIQVDGTDKTNTYMTKGGLYDGVTSGYYYNGNFYSDSEHKTAMEKKNKYVYVDISTGDVYSCNGSTYTKDNNIKFFTVSTDGLLTANNAVISGTIYATNGWFSGKITASEGEIGNWQILPSGDLKGTPSSTEATYKIILNPNYTKNTSASRQFYYTHTWKTGNGTEGTGEDDTNITDATINSSPVSFYIQVNDSLSTMQNNFVTAVKAVDRTFTWSSLTVIQKLVLNMQFIFFRSTLIDTNIFKIENTNATNSMIFGIDGNGFLNWRFYGSDTTFSSERSRFIIQTDTDGTNDSLNIGWLNWTKSTSNQAAWSFTSDGNLNLSKLKSTSYKDNLGGFQLYGEDASDKFWNNSLFTTNTIGEENYVGFLRAVGSSSESLSNVFIGCKQCKKDEWPTNNEWSSSNYNFYIRFDGKAKFETFHTKKWTSSGIIRYAIRPNEIITSRSCKYYLGTTNFPWDGLYLRAGSTTYNVNNLFDTNTHMTLNNVSIASSGTGTVNVDTYQINGSNVLYSNASTGSTLNVGTVNASQMNSKIYIPIASVKEPTVSGTALATASNVNQNGWNYAARQLDAGGFSYYCVDSIRAGLWSSTSGVNVTWDIGIDGSSGKKKTFGIETVDKDKITFRYVINLVAAHDGTMSQYATYAPRSSFQFTVNRDTSGTLDGEWSYFINKRRHSNNSTYGSSMIGNPKSCLGHSDYPWGYGYITTIVNTNTSSITSIAETYANTSDIRLKDVQHNFDKSKLLTLYNILNPIAYKYKNLQDIDNHSRTHLGFLAQEVEQAVFKVGLTNEDYAIIQIENLQTPIPGCEDGKKYYLNYNELHGLHVLKNQEQDKRILELEQKVQCLENKILELSGKGV